MARYTEQQQRDAAYMLASMLRNAGSLNADTAVQQLVGWLSYAGWQVGDWEVRKELRIGGEPGSPAMSMVFKVFNGTEYLATLKIIGSKFDPHLNLNLSLLASFVQHLPLLEEFDCDECSGSPLQQLPPALAAAAPRMRALRLRDCQLSGALPDAWGNWSSIEQLILTGNNITGTLPEAYAYMSNLQLLDVAGNMLQGTLPALWGAMQTMPVNAQLNLQGNAAFQGSIPAEWAHFSNGSLSIEGTQLGGCSPGRLLSAGLPACSSSALLPLKALLQTTTSITTSSTPCWGCGMASWIEGACTTGCCSPIIVATGACLVCFCQHVCLTDSC
jgi:hypothetical protein